MLSASKLPHFSLTLSYSRTTQGTYEHSLSKRNGEYLSTAGGGKLIGTALERVSA